MCSLILNKLCAFLTQYVLLSWVLCFTFFIFFSSCLHSLSIQVWHLRPAHAGSISVCTLSAGWGWLGGLPLHTYITWTIFMCAGCFFRAADERDPERRTRCVGSACSLSVFFIWLGYDPGLSSVNIFCFYSCVWYVSQPVFLFHISTAVSHILLVLVPLLFLSTVIFLHPSLIFSGHNQLWVFFSFQ